MFKKDGKVKTIKHYWDECVGDRAIIEYENTTAYTDCDLEDAEKISRETGIKITKYEDKS